MATELKNFITLEEIKAIKEFYGHGPYQHSGSHPEDNTKLQWANSPLADWILKDILHKKLVPVVGENYRVSIGCGVFQRCYVPFGMHIDSKRRIKPNRQIGAAESPGIALLIPLDEGPHFNTVFWKNYLLDDDEKHKLFKQFIDMPASEVVDNGTGLLCDLEFCWQDPVKKLYDHLEFDTVYNWKLGSAAYWNRNQLHAASDFTKHHLYKDAITIFFE
jgi:hypothetical protein